MNRLVALALAVALAGCAGAGRVVRVYDGRVVEGRFVAPDAYASYLRGVLAEESGDLALARSSFERAVQDDGDDPEILARLGEVRCKADPSDGGADDVFSRALRTDRTHAGALAAVARCALLRGRDDEALGFATRATEADPTNVDLDALLVRAQAKRGDAAGRARVVALTLAHGERAAAWDALVGWGRGRHDPELLARGLVGLLGAAPMRSGEVELGAIELLGSGRMDLARTVAAAVADARRDLEVRGPRDATVARLAVDEALVRGDRSAALARATRGHVELAEVAARAALLEQKELATDIAKTVAQADPSSSGAQLVLSALDAKPKLVAATDSPPELCVLLFAARLADAVSVEAAALFLSHVTRRPMAPRDPLGAALSVDLAARGVLPVSSLTPDLRLELAARRRDAPPVLTSQDGLDARHELLFLALTQPRSREACTLLVRLANAPAGDAVVAFAAARIGLAGREGESRVFDLVREAAAASGASALALAAALEVGQRRGEDVAKTKTRLFAVARTPAERALSTP